MANEKRLIDANALRENFENIAYKCEYIEDMVFHLDAIVDEIENVPTVDAVEVVHGRWHDDLYDPRYVCLECDKWFLVEDATGAMNYCPNCGAKMDGDGNATD